MARCNEVQIIGEIADDKLESRPIYQKGGKTIPVINMHIKVLRENTDENTKEEEKFYKLPVAVWGDKLVKQCEIHLQKGDMVYVKGELRYNFIEDEETKERRIYTTIKASSVEFIEEKMKTEGASDYYQFDAERIKEEIFALQNKREKMHENTVRLMGNIVKGDNKKFVVAVDRLTPPKWANTESMKSKTDFVTIVNPEGKGVFGDVRKGAFVKIDGSLMTRKKEESEVFNEPRIVINARKVVNF